MLLPRHIDGGLQRPPPPPAPTLHQSCMLLQVLLPLSLHPLPLPPPALLLLPLV
jgi:hypothetical protein